MPPFAGLSDQQIWQLVSYIRSVQNDTPVDSDRGGAGVREGNAAAGEAVFFGRGACVGCHEVNGRGGIVGPGSLGRRPAAGCGLAPEDRRSEQPGRRTRRRRVSHGTRDGREIRGVRRNEDTFSLQMVDASGQLHLLDKRKLASVHGREPLADAGRLRDAAVAPADIDDLVAYLARCRAATCARRCDAADARAASPTIACATREAEPQNWLMYWGNYQGTHYSPLEQITPANVEQLQAAWALPMPGRARCSRARRSSSTA